MPFSLVQMMMTMNHNHHRIVVACRHHHHYQHPTTQHYHENLGKALLNFLEGFSMQIAVNHSLNQLN